MESPRQQQDPATARAERARELKQMFEEFFAVVRNRPVQEPAQPEATPHA